MNQDLSILGEKIVNMAKSNQVYAEIAEISLQQIKDLLSNPENFDQIPNPTDLMQPPQLSQNNQMAQQVMPQQPIQGTVYGQTLLAPMMGNQMQPIIPATGNIPFLYHEKQKQQNYQYR